MTSQLCSFRNNFYISERKSYFKIVIQASQTWCKNGRKDGLEMGLVNTGRVLQIVVNGEPRQAVFVFELTLTDIFDTFL